MRQIDVNKVKNAKKQALKEAKRRCKGKPDRVRHQMFIRLWEQNLAEIF